MFRLNSDRADLTTSLVGLQAAAVGLLTALAMLLNSSPGGIASLVLLAGLFKRQPVKAMAIWGAVYVPVTAVWTLSALDGPREMAAAVMGYASCGAVFYGGAAFLSERMLRSFPTLVPCASLGGAEAASAALGLVMAPVGLFAVNGSLGYLVAWFSVIGASAMIGLGASLAERQTRFGLPITVLVSFALCFLPGPPRPEFDGHPIYGIAHNPDPRLKWSSPTHAAENLERLQKMSDLVAGDGLIVWPEGAVTGTFDLGEAISKLDPSHLPLLFGMTRYSREGSPDLRNSAVLVTEDGVQVSEKELLVPFYEGSVPFIYESDLVLGTRRILTLLNGTRILPLICFEVFVPRPWFLGGLDADLIVVLSAETGFWPRFASLIADRHVWARELETGLRVVRVSDL
ncbi:MAG: hypothetical protein P8L68_19440 [Paracoccaceae bacterium]|nr:hypothetical protein [Paracoccaceae bacterium]MDG2260652.1 hypothetical protein [Paracoccaceae bacterium]